MSIRKSFATKLIVGILVLTMIIFTASLGVLFSQSRHLIRVEALNRSSSVLNTTLQRLSRNLMVIETATNTYCWMIERSFEPDSLMALTDRLVRLNPSIDGCSVTISGSIASDRVTASSPPLKRPTNTSRESGIKKRARRRTTAGWYSSMISTHWKSP